MDKNIQSLLDTVPDWKDRPAEVSPLSGGITNQNFRVDVDGESYVLRVCSSSTDPLGIKREHEYTCSKIVADPSSAPWATALRVARALCRA